MINYFERTAAGVDTVVAMVCAHRKGEGFNLYCKCCLVLSCKQHASERLEDGSKLS